MTTTAQKIVHEALLQSEDLRRCGWQQSHFAESLHHWFQKDPSTMIENTCTDVTRLADAHMERQYNATRLTSTGWHPMNLPNHTGPEALHARFGSNTNEFFYCIICNGQLRVFKEVETVAL